MQEYLRFVDVETRTRTGMISTGPDRFQTILLPAFEAALDA